MDNFKSRRMTVAKLPKCPQKTKLIDMVRDPEEALVYAVAVWEAHSWFGAIGYPRVEDLAPNLSRSQEHFYNCRGIHYPIHVVKLGEQLSEKPAREIFSKFERVKLLPYKKVPSFNRVSLIHVSHGSGKPSKKAYNKKKK